MGLFAKKFCDICGEQIKFLGNRKVEDGNMCKNCADKLSPWFSDRRRTTLNDIKEQLRDREANKARVAAFRADTTLGEMAKVLIDRRKGQFIVLASGRGMDDNPDVFDLNKIRNVEVDVRERRTEQTQRDKEGKTVSYDPPRFTYTYDFLLDIDVDHPYIDDMRFQVNRSSVKIETGIPYERKTILGPVKGFVPDPPDVTRNEEYQKYLALVNQMRLALLNRTAAAQVFDQISAQGFPPVPPAGHCFDPAQKPGSAPASGRGYSPTQAPSQGFPPSGRGSAPAPAPTEAPTTAPAPAPTAAPAPAAKAGRAVLCPYCMAKAEPDERGLCTYCGSKLV